MKKLFVTNPQQIIDLIYDATNSVEDAEYELGIHFAYESDSTVFAADFKILGSRSHEDDPYDGEPINQNVWRRTEDCVLPETYPILMVYHIEDTSDRFGKVSFRMYEFVTIDDFFQAA